MNNDGVRPGKTFTFKSFNDHLASIEITRTLRKDYHDGDDGQDSLVKSNFYKTLISFKDFNLTEDFCKLKNSLGSEISYQLLPQVLNRQEVLFKSVNRALSKLDSLAINEAIDLLVSLAIDINEDFYKFFDTAFHTLVKLLNSQDGKVIENVFKCFAELFIILWRCISKDITKVFRLYSENLFTFKSKEFIRIFAAQSFSYLVRKILRDSNRKKSEKKPKLISLILTEVTDNSSIIVGISNLLFEIIKGVRKQFNSYAEEFLTDLIQEYVSSHYQSENVSSCLLESFDLIANHTDRDNSKLVWSCLIRIGQEILQGPKERISSSMRCLLSLFHRFISFKSGQLVADSDGIVNFITSALESCHHYDECVDILHQISVILLRSPFLDLKPQNYQALVDACLAHNISHGRVFIFAKELFSHRLFETCFRPVLLKRCHSILTSDTSKDSIIETVKILYDMVNSCKPVPILQTLAPFESYSLKFNDESNLEQDGTLSFLNPMIRFLNDFDLNDLPTIRQVINIIPHIQMNSKESNIVADFRKALNRVVERIASPNGLEKLSEEQIECLQVIFCEVIYYLGSLSPEDLLNELKLDLFSNIFERCPMNPIILQAFFFYLQFVSEQSSASLYEINRQFYEQIYFQFLQDCLRHPKHQVRLLALLCINIFDPPMQPSESGRPQKSVFSICLEAELVEISIDNYREKLRLLNQLDPNLVEQSIPLPSLDGSNYNLAPVHFLIGNLFYNFKLLWEPVKKLLELHGRATKDRKSFWNVFSKHMKGISPQIKGDTPSSYESTFLWPGMKKSNEPNPRTDYYNHRILILQSIKSLVDIVGPLAQELVGWFLDFAQEEAVRAINFLMIGAHEDLSISNQEEGAEIETEEVEDEIEEVEDKSPQSKIIWDIFKAYLDILSRIRDPKKYDKEDRLHQIYCSLLQHKSSVVQKLALDCALAYDKKLSVYKEHLHNLLDDSQFKTEILAISSNDPEKMALQPSDRSLVMPYLMKILYGKLLSKTGTKTAGKANADVRRSIIFRFLASCSGDEIILFVELAFSDLILFMRMDYSQIIPEFEKISIKECLSLRRVQSFMKTLDLMLVHFGNIASNLLPSFVKLLLIISSFVKILLAKRDELNTMAISRLKTLRSECFKLTEKFFNVFEHYSFNCDEIDHLFVTLIDPMTHKLDNESLERPSPVLRLLYTWSQNPRYFILFVKKSSLSDESISTPLSSLIRLYQNPQASQQVVQYISSLLANLVSSENCSSEPINDPDVQPSEPLLKIHGLISDDLYDEYTKGVVGSLQDPLSTDEGRVNFGTIILLPHISPILGRLQQSIENRLKNKGAKKLSIISENESVIISHISSQIVEPKDRLKLADLLIKCIKFSMYQDEELCKVLSSINNLIANSKGEKNCADFFQRLGPLFGKIEYRTARLTLCDILTTIARIDPQYSIHEQLIRKINAYDPRMPEEPNYIERGDGFISAKKLIEEEKNISKQFIDLIVLLIHNCCFFIRTTDDIGLREMSSTCLKNIIMKLSASDGRLFKSIVIDLIFLKNVKSGLVQPNERARHEFITVLTYLVQYGKDKNNLLKQLSQLSNEDNSDRDFWINITHIQIPRRIGALEGLSKNQQLLCGFTPQLLQDFLLPIAIQFIIDLRPTQYRASIDKAVHLIGSISRNLPWSHYEKLLRSYLKKTVVETENHKTNVRILCSILNNFNFDLKNSSRKNDDSKIRLDCLSGGASFQLKIMDPVSASRIHGSIVSDILPKLHSCLHKLSYSDYEYDIIRGEFNPEDQIHRIPMATAMVKLLFSIPMSRQDLDSNIRKIFLRLGHFLKSRMDSIRETSRQTLCKIMAIIGPKYLMTLIEELKPIMNRGFRLHVLTFTLYIIVEHMSSSMKSGDLDQSASSLIDIYHKELFTDSAEEKKVAKITSKCKEAKTMKSYAIYRFIGKFISDQTLIKSIIPLKQILDSASTPKVMKKVSICMQKFFLGLIDNSGLTHKHMLKFILDVLEDKIPLLQASKAKSSKKEKIKRTKDCRLFEPEKKRKRAAKSNPISNVFVLFENCLKLLLSMFKKGRIAKDADGDQNLDKFVPILINSLQSRHAKVSATAIRCINQIVLKFPHLEGFLKQSDIIKVNLMLLLSEFIGHGSNTSESVELITMCFKCLSAMIKFIDRITLTKDQLEELLLYVDSDMTDRNRQSTAFSILKAIIGKKMESPLLKDIMQKLTLIMLQSDNDHVRQECRLIWARYLLNFPLASQFANHVHFFTRQLEYPREIGRLAVLNLILTLIKYQNIGQISDNAATFYLALASLMINDESIKCRETASLVIKRLLSRISKKARDSLFSDLTKPWFVERNQLHQRLATQLFGLFVVTEGKDFEARLPEILPLLQQKLDPVRFSDNIEQEEQKRSKDHLLFQLLNLLLKIVENLPATVANIKYRESFSIILSYVEQHYLIFPHLWVRIISIKIMSTIFSSVYSSDLIVKSLIHKRNEDENESYLLKNTSRRLWELCKKHCSLFPMIYESPEIRDLLVQNLVHIGRIYMAMADDTAPCSIENGVETIEVNDNDKSREKININWLIRRMLHEVKNEIQKSPNNLEARILVLEWLDKVFEPYKEGKKYEKKLKTVIEKNLEKLLGIVCHEITSKKRKDAERASSDDPRTVLFTKSEELFNELKLIMGRESFSTALAQVTMNHNQKRNMRKAVRAAEMINNPVKALKRKAKKHHAWNETKKRRKIEGTDWRSRKRARMNYD
ncbi:small subunit processome component 20 homolog [Brevipalpus obovatus]|uniref:small subunit processome component 20 homolog n=1 Tax=Brevipalpus obovatus TaxID=246614 RepID=UPI003D9F9A12